MDIFVCYDHKNKERNFNKIKKKFKKRLPFFVAKDKIY